MLLISSVMPNINLTPFVLKVHTETFGDFLYKANNNTVEIVRYTGNATKIKVRISIYLYH